MDEKQWRVEALLSLYKQQMEHYHHTQQVEWKANFGVWTLLAGAIYQLPKEGIHICPCVASIVVLIIVLLIIVVVHAWWLCKVHSSEVCDKKLWIRYRAEALALIRGIDAPKEREEEWNRSLKDKVLWLVLEVGITILLCAVLFVTLTR
jgi:hypothetical protein